jgi:hypothetical protein
MKIYIVVWKDRHSDTSATPFLNFEKARAWAKKQAEESCRHKKYLEESPVEGWLYHIEYSVEGDCLWITEHDLKQ